jgi:hypothetical protein
MADWFGKDCPFQVARHPHGHDLGKEAPIATLCEDPFNAEDGEGNCVESLCPRLKMFKSSLTPNDKGNQR